MKNISFLVIIWFLSTSIFAQTSQSKYLIKYLETNTSQPDYGVTFLNDNQFIYKSPNTDKINLDSEKLSPSNLFIATIGIEGDVTEKRQIQGLPTDKITKTGAAYSNDLKTVYFSAKKYRKKPKRNDKEQLFMADVDADGNWSNITKLPFSNIKYSFGEPALSNTGNILYFTSDMPSTLGGADLFKIEIKNDGSFGEPQNLGATINTSKHEVTPYISKDNMLYFSSNGHAGSFGGLDVYVSDISSNNPTEPIHLDAPINSVNDDFAFIINDNNNRGYFSSNRLQGKNNHDIYSFLVEAIAKDKECIQAITGIVKDKESDEVIKEAIITLFDEDNNEIEQVKTDVDGAYKLTLECNKMYTLKASGETYNTEEHIVNTANYLEAPTLEANKFLTKNTDLVGENVETVIAEVDQKKEETVIEETIEQNIEEATDAPKEEAVQNVVGTDNMATNDTEEEEQVVDEAMANNEVIKEEVVTHVEEVVAEEEVTNTTIEEDEATINAVYFGFDKFNITTKAAKELDKLTTILKNNSTIHIEVAAYTDSRGSSAYNLGLSKRRAEASADYLVAQGIDRSRITTIGHGESKMVNKCIDGIECSEAAHEKNRRTEFSFINAQATTETFDSKPSESVTKTEQYETQEESVEVVSSEVEETIEVEEIIDSNANQEVSSSDESFTEIGDEQLKLTSSTEEVTDASIETDNISDKEVQNTVEEHIESTDELSSENNITNEVKLDDIKIEDQPKIEETIAEKIVEEPTSEQVESTEQPIRSEMGSSEAERNEFNELLAQAEEERNQEVLEKNVTDSNNNKVDQSLATTDKKKINNTTDPNELLAQLKANSANQKTENPSIEDKVEITPTVKEVKAKVNDETIIAVRSVTVKAMQSKRGKYIETQKAKKIQALRVTFRVQENFLATLGYKDAYVVILSPEGKVVNEKGVFTLADGSDQGYTDDTTIYYNNQSMKVVMFIDRIVHKFTKGAYKVNIFIEGNLVGSNTMKLVS